ncbi:MAG: 23S rRNA (pseudouridine(1915)-N(3))-methyltransferase RlmH [Gemmatimonadales bacterium]|nr:23S rRNA (pseudouridine(1915)-N(3))-methyltransferase RlmH [Gemmatimonadales bacterium]
MVTQLIAVGRLRPAFREACDDYLARLRRFGEVEEREIREGPATASADEQRRFEGRKILEAIPDRAAVIVLDRTGTAWSSTALAAQLDRWRQRQRTLALVIGGSTGVDESVLTRAEARWSLGPLTLPHELARVVVVEQWYRALTILHGIPYHK